MLSKRLQILFEPNNDCFRRLRKVTQAILQPKSVQVYRPVLLQEAKKVIVDILNDPHNHQAGATRYVKRYSAHPSELIFGSLYRFATSVMTRILYGKSGPTSHDAPEVLRIRRIKAHLGIALHPSFF